MSENTCEFEREENNIRNVYLWLLLKTALEVGVGFLGGIKIENT